jgi:hypothetical protein
MVKKIARRIRLLGFLAALIGQQVLAQPVAINSGDLQKSKKTELESCLHNERQVQVCIAKKIKNLSIDSCFASAQKLKSDFLKEETQEFCFFQVSEFPSLEACTQKAVLFKSAANHDEALFECVRQHQATLTKQSCLSIAERMRYPEKLKYLSRQCDAL